MLELTRALPSPGLRVTDVAMESWNCILGTGESQGAPWDSRCSADVAITAIGDAIIPAGTDCTLFLPRTKT